MPSKAKRSKAKSQAKSEPAPSSVSMAPLAIVVALFAALYAANQQVDHKALLGPNAETKPFDTWEEFYPFYLTEHSNQICRRLHVVGTTIVIALLVMYPKSALSIALAGLVGLQLRPWLAWQASGLVEFGAMMLLYFGLGRKLNGRWLPVLIIPLVGYSFAWVGHFFFELNKPATFIYPTYSLISDFRLWYEMLVARSLPL